MMRYQINNRGKQSGQVLLMFLVCLALLSLSIPLAKLTQLSVKHDWQVLRQANMALITWSLARFPGREKDRDLRPGELVMPDKDAPDAKVGVGVQDSTAKIGRLPWKTLGVPPLIDADGELLWYSVSSRFRDNGQDIKPLACDGLEQLAIWVEGQSRPTWQTGISAVVIASHRAIGLQQRANAVDKTQAYQYIEKGDLSMHSASLPRHFLQGRVIKEGKVMANDDVVPMMCAALHRGLQRRLANENRS